ncbi:MAG TPA: hypothetical protein VN956_06770 [Pyrinomonadaceae bacterium]|nr:hypothetical protein [Pyrinomonadaceae bacterium]
MIRTRLVITVLMLLTAHSVWPQDKPSLSEVDRIRLAEAFRLAESLGNRVWKDWDKAPFAVLLVTPEYEFLIRHPRPSKDFTPIGYDSMLKSDVYFRKRKFPTDRLATFPAVGGVSTIVIGRAENTDKKTSTPWVITMLHEHFHQLQDSQLNSYAETEALNLSHGDQTGMWMLNYAFPYDSAEVKQQFSVLSRLLVEALQAKKKSAFSTRLAAYLEARRQVQKMLSPDDYKYFSFQLWKEGLARYTEYRVAKLAAHKYKPSKQFRALKDFASFGTVADQILSTIMKVLSTLRLEDSKRVAFYPLGAGEGFLLDRANPKWQSRYFVDKFYVEKYFDAAK